MPSDIPRPAGVPPGQIPGLARGGAPLPPPGPPVRAAAPVRNAPPVALRPPPAIRRAGPPPAPPGPPVRRAWPPPAPPVRRAGPPPPAMPPDDKTGDDTGLRKGGAAQRFARGGPVRADSKPRVPEHAKGK
jgi:hypothetical protein